MATKQTHFSRYNRWLIPMFGETYDPRVLYMMFNYLKLDPKENSKEINKLFSIGIIWNHMMITQETIKRLYPIFEEEVEKDDIINNFKNESKNIKVIFTENQIKRLRNILNEK